MSAIPAWRCTFATGIAGSPAVTGLPAGVTSITSSTGADGGATNLDNLIVVCRRQHTLLHEGGFGLTGTARAPTFTRADHTTIDL